MLLGNVDRNPFWICDDFNIRRRQSIERANWNCASE
jgi:hypothetical protein